MGGRVNKQYILMIEDILNFNDLRLFGNILQSVNVSLRK